MKKRKVSAKNNEDNTASFRKLAVVFLLVIFIGLLFRMSNVDKTIVFDEYIQTNSVMNHNSAGLEIGPEIPPLTTWTRLFFTSIFGVSTSNIKLVSVIFGLLTIFVVFLIAKELYDKKIAIISSSLLFLSAWHILVTTSISFDGAFLTFYCMLTLLFFIRYVKFNDSKWLYLTGVAFGLAMLTKYNAILLVPALFAYYLYEKKNQLYKNKSLDKKNVLTTLKAFLIIGLVGFLVFLIFPISAYLTDWSQFTTTLGHTNQLKSTVLNVPLLAIQFALAAIWAGPLFIMLYLLSFKFYERRDFLIHAWIVVNLLFYIFVVGENSRPVERYFIAILPVICLLGAKVISSLKFEKKHIIIFFTAFIIWLSAIFCMNLSYNDILPFYPKTEFINHVVGLDWNFLVPFTGDQGPLGMYVAFNSIAFSFILAVVFAKMFFFSKSEKWKINFFVLFFAVALAFNIFMVLEMSYSLTNQDIDFATKEAINYANENRENLSGNIFVFRNYALRYYLFEKYEEITILDFEKLDSFNVVSPSTILVVDFPKIDEKSGFWDKLNSNCKLEYIGESKISKIYTC